MSEYKIDVKAHIKGDVSFVEARTGNLWYRTASGFDFPVPFADMGNGVFGRQIKGITMMRYIRKHAAYLDAARQPQPAD